MKTAEIIAIGSELLTPYRLDTNSLWLTERLHKYGISVQQKHIIGDDLDHLARKFSEASKRADLVITSGGLGPTFDDITRNALANAFDLKLVYHDEIFEWIKEIYGRRNLVPTENNRQQAMVPEGGRYFKNTAGTAPGLVVETAGTVFILLPGPPKELTTVFSVIEKEMFSRAELKSIYTRKFKLANIPESLAESLLSDIKIPDDASWSILASPGQVEAHVHVNSDNKDYAKRTFDEFENMMKARVGSHYFGVDDDSLESVVIELLRQKNMTIALAESCTGGWLAKRMTDISGSSDVFRWGVVSYANEAKEDLLGIPEQLFIDHGAVSHEVACAMARGIKARAAANVGVAITGIAGPTGGTDEKPVGTVFIAINTSSNEEISYRFQFFGDRERIRFQATQSALDVVRVNLLGVKLESSFMYKEQEIR